MSQGALDAAEGNGDVNSQPSLTAILDTRERVSPSCGEPSARSRSAAELPRNRLLVANALSILVGNIAYAGCQWGVVVLLAKVGSPRMVGTFSLGLAVTAPVFMFLNLQIRSVQATDMSGEYTFGDYLGLRLLTTLLGLVVIAGLGFIPPHDRETSLVIFAVGVAKAVESLSDLFYGLQQQHERMDSISWSLALRGAGSLVGLGAGLALTGSVLGGTLGLALAWAVVLAVHDIPRSISLLQAGRRGPAPAARAAVGSLAALRPSWAPRTLLRLTWLALPLGLVMMLISLNVNIPRYFLEGTRGQRELGIFAALAYLVVAGNLVISALGQAASPRLARYHAAGDVRRFRSLQLALVGVGGLVGVVAVLLSLAVGDKLLALLYTPEYAEHASVLLWLMVAAGLGYIASFLGYGMTAARYFRVQAPLFAAVALITTVACGLLVPQHGLVGAALAILIAAAAQFLGSALIVLAIMHRLGRVPGQ